MASLDRALQDEIIRLYKAGASVKTIQATLQVNPYRIRQTLDLAGIPIRGSWENLPNVNKNKQKPRGRFAHLK